MTVELLAPEEEEPVLDDWPTDLIANVVVAVQRRSIGQISLQLVLLVEPFIGVQAFMTMKKATIAVPLVAAALGDQGNLSAGSLSEFSLVVGGENLHLFNRIGIDRDVGSAIVAGIDVRCAVDRHFMLVRARAIDIERIQAARSRGMAVKHTCNSGHELHVIQHVATIDGDIVQLFAGHQHLTALRSSIVVEPGRYRQ